MNDNLKLKWSVYHHRVKLKTGLESFQEAMEYCEESASRIQPPVYQDLANNLKSEVYEILGEGKDRNGKNVRVKATYTARLIVKK